MDVVGSNRTETDAAPDPACEALLQKLSAKVDGKQVLYATRFLRPEGKVKGTKTSALARAAFEASLKQVSKALASGIPNDGWIVVTEDGLSIFGRTPVTNGVGAHKGTITKQYIQSVAVKHSRKPGKSEIFLILADDSEATLLVKTKETYSALSPWIQGLAAVAEAAIPQTFDTDELFRKTTGLH